MPFTLTPVSVINFTKETNAIAIVNSNSLVAAVNGNDLWYVTDLAAQTFETASGFGSVYGVALDNGYIFTIDSQNNLKSRSLVAFGTTIDTEVISQSSGHYGVQASNGYVFVLSDDKLRIFTHSSGVLTLQNTVTIASSPYSKTFRLIGNFLYMLNGDEMRIFSIAVDPINPVLKAEITGFSDGGGANLDVAVKGNYMYLVKYDNSEIFIKDITAILSDTGPFPLNNAGVPTVNTIVPEYNFHRLTINADTLFTIGIGNDLFAMQSFDITNHLAVADLGTVTIAVPHQVTGTLSTYVLESVASRLIFGTNEYTFGAKNLRTSTFSLTPSAPTIDSITNSQDVNSGASLTFEVEASGTVPLSYQWKKNGVNIPGAVASTYNIPVVSASDAASYTVYISNIAGNTTSGPIVITVNTTPVIEGQPEGDTVNAGNSMFFSVNAVGGIPLSYQWKKNGVNILGATSSSYTIPSVIPTDAGDYSCVVANSFGSEISQSATLEVNPVPGTLVTLADNITNANNFSTVIVGNKLFMLGDVAGISMYDVTDPINPVLLDTKFYAGGSPSWMIVSDGNYLYATWNNSLISINITGIGNTLPASPTSTVSGNFKWLAIDGTALYAGKDTGNPKEVVRFNPVAGVIGSPVWTQTGLGSSVMGAGAVYGNFVVAATSSIITVMDKATGAITSQLSGSWGNGSFSVPDIEIYQNALYVIGAPDLGGFGIRVYDLSNSGVIGSLITSGTFSSGMSNAVYTLTRKNNFLYASDASGKMFVFDITNPHSPLFFAASATLPERFRKPSIDDIRRVFATTFSNPSRLVTLIFDTAPIITSTAPDTCANGVLYSYQPTIADNITDISAWTLIDAPLGMTVNSGTGLVQWTPSGVLTSGTFYLKATGMGGLIDVERITIYVSQGINFTPGTPVTSAPTPSGNTLTIPGNTYSSPATFQFTELPINDQGAANIKFLDYGFDITTTGSNTFDHPITLTIHYTDAQLVAAGITKENKMKVLFFDVDTNKWVSLHTVINTQDNTATAQLPHLTDFGFGEGSGGAAKVDTVINGHPVTVLTYLRDTGETDSKMYYVFVDANNNLVISQKPVHSQDCQCDVIGEDSVVE